MKTVSVILPNYNHSKYLTQRIRSIINQTYSDFELIILDDCSTDSSRSIIEGYKNHPKIKKTIYNKKNSGSTFKQWHKGIELAKGEYIWIAESDDYCDNTFLEEMVKCLDQNPNTGFAYCRSHQVDSEGKIIIRRSNETSILVHNGIEFIKNQLVFKNSIYNASMAIFRKAQYKKILHSNYQKFKYCGDWYFWILLAEISDVIELKTPLNYFRRHCNTVSIKSEENGLYIIEGLEIYKYINKYLSCFKKIEVLNYWSKLFVKSKFENHIKKQVFQKCFQKLNHRKLLYFLNLGYFNCKANLKKMLNLSKKE